VSAGLYLNGINIPVSTDGAERPAPLLIGDRQRAFSGGLIDTVRARKQSLHFKTPPLAFSVTTALRGLLHGDGHHWSFNVDFYSDKGLTYSANTDVIGISGSLTGLGAYADFAAARDMTWTPGYTADWTVIAWEYNSTGPVYTHWVVCSNSTQYSNGVTTGSPPAWLTVNTGAGTVKISGVTKIADFAMVPYIMPATWAANLFALGHVPFSSLPNLNATGDLVASSMTVLGTVGGASLEMVQSSGTYGVAERLDFTLDEV
jgi:hypothetical protein